jgi:alpha-1,6-mannosyltransferase
MSLAMTASFTALLHASVAIAQYAMTSQADVAAGVLLYYGSVAALVFCYASVVQSIPETPTRRDWLVIAGVPFLLQIGWLVPHPVLSIDAYTYVVNAAHIHAGLNPYQHASSEAIGTALGGQLVTYGWRPLRALTPYGPVWVHLLSIAGPFAGNAAVAVRIIKLIAFAATTVAALLLFRVAPASFRMRALTLFWWNPVVIIEGAGEGHNDAVMVVAVVLSLWLLRYRAVAPAAAALTLAALTKWVPAFFAPAYLAYVWRNHLLTKRTVLGAGIAVAVATCAAYWRFWVGASTFAGLQTTGRVRFVASVTGSLVRVLADQDVFLALLRAGAVSALATAVIYVTARTRRFADLVRGCAAIAMTFVLLAAPLYWPWYVVMPIALLAIAGDVGVIVVLTATSRMVAPLEMLRLGGAFSTAMEVWLTTIVALWLPLAYIAWITVGRRRLFADAAR